MLSPKQKYAIASSLLTSPVADVLARLSTLPDTLASAGRVFALLVEDTITSKDKNDCRLSRKTLALCRK